MTKDLHRSASPATYDIAISGHLDTRWSSRLGGMSIVRRIEDGGPVTILSGKLSDQAALLGVLNVLLSIGVPLRSIQQQACEEPEEL